MVYLYKADLMTPMVRRRAYIANETHPGYLTDLERKCMVIKLSIQDGDYNLDDALKLNQVSKADFEGFIAKHLVSDLKSTLSALQSSKLQLLITADVLLDVYKQLLGNVDKQFYLIENHLRNLTHEIAEDKVAF
jgi:hypothetical protein